MRALFLIVALLLPPAAAGAALPPAPAAKAPAAAPATAAPAAADVPQPAGGLPQPEKAAATAGAPTPAPAPATAAPVPHPAAAPTATPAPMPGRITEAAPRPTTEVRIQNRYATKERLTHLFAGGMFLERGDFFNSPGLQVGLTYWAREWLGLEAQAGYFFSWLNSDAEDIRKRYGAIPDSHAPGLLVAVGARASAGYGKLLLSGTHRTLHFEPQAFLHVGAHFNDGDFGPSANTGIGLFFFISPRLFARLDLAMTWELEKRSGSWTNVWGALPMLVVGGVP